MVWLADEVDEFGNVWAGFACDKWYELQEELIETIKEILASDNQTKGTDYPLEGIGTRCIIRPFMERNGYRDCSGWWIKEP